MYIQEKIDLLRRRHAAGKVNSVTGFLLTAIKHNYSNAEFAQVVQQEQKTDHARHEAAEARQDEEMRRHFDAYREQRFWEYFRAQPQEWQEGPAEVTGRK